MQKITEADVRVALHKTGEPGMCELMKNKTTIADLTRMLNAAHQVVLENGSGTGKHAGNGEKSGNSKTLRTVANAGKLGNTMYSFVEQASRYGNSARKTYNPKRLLLSVTANQTSKIIGAGTLTKRPNCAVAVTQLAATSASVAVAGKMSFGVAAVISAAVVLDDAMQMYDSCFAH